MCCRSIDSSKIMGEKVILIFIFLFFLFLNQMNVFAFTGTGGTYSINSTSSLDELGAVNGTSSAYDLRITQGQIVANGSGGAYSVNLGWLRIAANLVTSNVFAITVSSPTNSSYDTGQQVWANVTLNAAGNWCGYSLDGAANTTMSNDTTMNFYAQLPALSESRHSIGFSCNSSTNGTRFGTSPLYFTIRPWYTVNITSLETVGAVNGSSSNYEVRLTVGQLAVANGSGGAYSVNLGWLHIAENIGCSVAIGLSTNLTDGAYFGGVDPTNVNYTAQGNNGTGATTYYISVATSGGTACTADLYIKASGDLYKDGDPSSALKIGLGNETVAYSASDPELGGSSYTALKTAYSQSDPSTRIGSNLANGAKSYLKFKLFMPVGQPASVYNNTLSIKAVVAGTAP